MEYKSRKADFYVLGQQKYDKQVSKCLETCFVFHEQCMKELGKIISSGGNKKPLLYCHKRAGYSEDQSGKHIRMEDGSMMLVYYVFTLNAVSFGILTQPQDLEI